MELTMAFFVTTFVLVYILNLPHSLGESRALAREYYHGKHTFFYVHLDLVLVALYLFIGRYIIKKYDVQDTIKKTLIIGGVSFLITTLFMFYFRNYGNPTSFFTRWFNTIGWKACLYDVLLVCSVFLIEEYIKRVSS